MISFLTAIAAAALLFILAGLFRQKECSGRCPGCVGSCAHYTKEEHDVPR